MPFNSNSLKRSLFSTLAAVLVSTGAAFSESPVENTLPALPTPTAQHQWLKQLVGSWEGETEMQGMPGKPAEHAKSTENVRPVGEFWTMTEVKSTMMQKPFVGNMTMGYDAEKGKFIATWVDSMTGKLWEYEGMLDDSQKVLTLETEGVCPMNPGKVSKFKEVLELNDANHKTYTSSIMGEDGKWMTMFTSHSKRK
jgi:Protein of unknown function (DUF1579)